MPPIRHSISAKPMKTERTHEENQERAYIAASRRSDRSLEARIESARRASEIHKKRTGRALRVTEQDVVNEEMYEEEDDDLPAQYQRLSAHLHTGSMMFNRKLQDYIATQSAVRNGFMQQYSPPFFQQQFGPNNVPFSHTMGGMFGGQQMPPPQMFNNSSAQAFDSQTYPQSPQGFRQGPYPLPHRPQSHQRSSSIPILTPRHMQGFQQSIQHANDPVGTPRGDAQRRMSLPPPHQAPDSQSQPLLSPSSTAHSVQQQHVSPQQTSPPNVSLQHISRHSMSPHHNNRSAITTPPALESPTSQTGNTTPTSYHFAPNHQLSPQALSANPLSMSLPPESQQFVGSALDPNDPHTAIFMAGSENIPQPFGRGTYTYNPNGSSKNFQPTTISPVSGQSLTSNVSSSAMDQTLSLQDDMKVETATDSSLAITPSSAMTDTFVSPSLTSFDYHFSTLGDTYQNVDFMSNTGMNQVDFDADCFLDFDANP